MNGLDGGHDDLESGFGARAQRRESASREQEEGCVPKLFIYLFSYFLQILLSFYG